MNDWPADKVERRSVARLVPYARNARTHTDEQVGQIAASIREWGWTVPILIDEEGGIIAGHGRVLAAQRLGIADVPTMTATGWSEAQKRAYVLADNKLALNAGWDDELLKVELADLQDMDFDIGLTGFADFEIADLLADKTVGLTDPDDVPDVQADAITVKGDTWLLGKHRLRCGDSTSADDVAALMAGQIADLCFTSPPYAQQRDYKEKITDWDGLMNGVFTICPVKDGAQILVNLGLVYSDGRVNAYWDNWLDVMRDAGWPLFGWYVWDKGSGLPGNWNGRLAPAHEFIFHFSKGNGAQANKWVDKKPENIKPKTGGGLRKKDGTMGAISSPHAGLNKTKIADSVIRVTPAHGKNEHPAMFPVALCEEIYKSYAKAGDWVYEPFSGSGTSIIACEGMGMNCAAMELSEQYTDIAIRRWQAFTGQSATLEGDGRTFDEIAGDRCSAAA